MLISDNYTTNNLPISCIKPAKVTNVKFDFSATVFLSDSIHVESLLIYFVHLVYYHIDHR